MGASQLVCASSRCSPSKGGSNLLGPTKFSNVCLRITYLDQLKNEATPWFTPVATSELSFVLSILSLSFFPKMKLNSERYKLLCLLCIWAATMAIQGMNCRRKLTWAASPKPHIRASTLSLCSCANAADVNSNTAAPSLMLDELPAVIVPSSLNTGRSFLNFSGSNCSHDNHFRSNIYILIPRYNLLQYEVSPFLENCNNSSFHTHFTLHGLWSILWVTPLRLFPRIRHWRYDIRCTLFTNPQYLTWEVHVVSGNIMIGSQNSAHLKDFQPREWGGYLKGHAKCD